ncbi:hypothetical protein BX666DRAFT_2030087 [Dichotomocladium elegans]|nr:hypothetical protein BX666DRAFT_2030087 [Dichotomocladium elegans]
MPQHSVLQHVQEQLAAISKEAENLSKGKYTAENIQHLQNKLHHIDEKYREGVIDDRDKHNPNDDSYEENGQAQIAESLNKVHETLSCMLRKV